MRRTYEWFIYAKIFTYRINGRIRFQDSNKAGILYFWFTYIK